jgi:hypothetical protein
MSALGNRRASNCEGWDDHTIAIFMKFSELFSDAGTRLRQRERKHREGGGGGQQAPKAKRLLLDRLIDGQARGLEGVECGFPREKHWNPWLIPGPALAAYRRQSHGRGVAAQAKHGIGHLQMSVGFFGGIDTVSVQFRQWRFGNVFDDPHLIQSDQPHGTGGDQGQPDNGAPLFQKAAAFAPQLMTKFSWMHC